MSLPPSMTGPLGVRDFRTWKQAVERYLASLDRRIASKTVTDSVSLRSASVPVSGVPVGAAMLWPYTSQVPDGWLAAGTEVDPDTYPDLYAITGPSLPDIASVSGTWIIRALP